MHSRDSTIAALIATVPEERLRELVVELITVALRYLVARLDAGRRRHSESAPAAGETEAEARARRRRQRWKDTWGNDALWTRLT